MNNNSSVQSIFSDAGGMQNDTVKRGQPVYFMRPELTRILDIYGRMVAAGEWRDYAIDHMKDQAVFSIFRRNSEMPLYSIIKEPARVNQQGMWRIAGMDGRIVKRGHELMQTLRYFDRLLMKALD